MGWSLRPARRVGWLLPLPYPAGVANPAPKARPILVAQGWRKRTGDFYTRPLAPGVEGLLSLAPNRGLPHQWRLQPSVGVIHEKVKRCAVCA